MGLVGAGQGGEMLSQGWGEATSRVHFLVCVGRDHFPQSSQPGRPSPAMSLLPPTGFSYLLTCPWWFGEGQNKNEDGVCKNLPLPLIS